MVRMIAMSRVLARTTPLDQVKSPTHGLSLFYTPFDRDRIKVSEIEKMGRKAVDSNELFFEDFIIPEADRIGEEGKGFEYILHGLNPERILIAAEAVGLGFDLSADGPAVGAILWRSATRSWRRLG